MPLVYACIAPHGGELIPALAGRNLSLFSPTRKGMRVLAKRMKESRPDTIVIATPHNLRLKKHIGIVISQYSSGSVTEGGKEVRLRARCDIDFAESIASRADRMGLPVVAANYGALEGPDSNLPMDWGTLIPLWFLLRATRPRSRIVIVTPSRGIPLKQNFQFGRVIAAAADDEEKRVAFVASADQAHSHRKDGPYGYHAFAAEYDRRVMDVVRADRLGSVLSFRPSLVQGAKPDSLWQLAMLAGALSLAHFRGELVSYQVPTYYGMLCASFQPF